MEAVLIPVEDILIKAKSKRDIYQMLTIDLEYFLPSFEKCPISFLRDVLKGKKKLIKIEKVSLKVIPRYKELSVKNIWEYIREVEEIYQYFPDYTEKQLPERDYLFAIVSTLRPDSLDSLVSDARKKRSLNENPELEDFVEITKSFKEEINNVLTQKTTKDRAAYLLKCGASHNQKRRNASQFSADYSTLDKKFKAKFSENSNQFQSKFKFHNTTEMKDEKEEVKE